VSASRGEELVLLIVGGGLVLSTGAEVEFIADNAIADFLLLAILLSFFSLSIFSFFSLSVILL